MQRESKGRAYALRLSALAGAALAGIAPAYAQEAPASDPQVVQDNGEIVVTARFREESLTDVPIAITALKGDTLASRNLNTLQDIAQTVPTVDFRAGSSNKDRSTFIRGIGTITTSPGVEPSVATVIDGVVLARPGQSTLDLLDIERIEILRGPQGTLFGKNASAGVINIVSKEPAKELGFNAQLGAYEGGEYRVRLGASGPIGDDWGFAVTGLFGGFKGNVRNVTTGDWVNGYDRLGGRGKLVYQPADNLKFTLAGDYVFTYENVPTGVFVATSRVAFPTGAVTPNADLAAILAASGIVANADNTKVAPSFDADVRDKNFGGSFTAEIGLGDHTLTSITAYRKWRNRQHQDWDSTGTLTAATASGEDIGKVDSDQFSQELRLTSPKGKLIDYVVGLYYFHTVARERYQRSVTRLVGGAPVSDLGVANYRTDLDNYSVFGEANINFTPQFRAILGGRLIHDDLAYEHSRVATTATGVAGIRPSFASAGSTKRTDYSLRAGLQYDVSARINLYATYSRGYKGPAYNVFFNMQAFDVNPLAPETSDSFEAGLKGSAGNGTLTYSLAAFLTKFHGFQANFQDTYLGTLVTRLINAGDVSSRGVEGDITVRPIRNLTLSGAFAYNDAHIDSFLCPASAGGACANVDGRPLPFAPKWKFHVDGNYHVPITDTLGVDLQSDFSWKDDTQYSITQTPDTIQPAYGIWNASVGLVSDAGKGWEVRAVIKNIANQHYSPAIAYGAVAGVSRFVPRDNSRYVGVNANLNF
ncbi:TonB-dependent receptor [Sphingomonas sp. JC676]|uniref:TonB-dependent receptor n=1 Tax=Sphingomonas sp. JC676 TaxID=2768065 RepID=UPI001657C4AF|nr:TonB-dependent receptor [Sphingomonas sp. JC676]MBC9033053.1 TonB-dependent receptor [Sphingomonas sp. JC676]